ncbi:MAG: hypothetical protein ACFKPT_14440 [Gloeotrichia echinulata GP01]
MELKYFSQHYKIDLTGDEDWFDPRMSLDTSLYIDPFMVFKSKHSLFANAKDKFFDFFKAVFELAHEAISSKLAYQKLEIILKFPEVKEVCLGVSKKGTSGSGSGGGGSKAFAEAFVELAKAGHQDIKHFEEIEIFTGGIGEDKISDATANLIKLELIEYTQSICKELNVPTLCCAINNASFDFEDKSWDSRIFNLPKNPFFQKERGVILVPKEFLREMHAISSDGFAEYISGKKNEELRAYLNYDINKELKKTNIKKAQIRDFARTHRDTVDEYVQHLQDNAAAIQPYNLDVDKKNLYRNGKKASEFILANPLSLSASNEQEFTEFLEKIVQQCKFLMEEKGGYKLLWDELNQLPNAPIQYKSRTESEAQNLLAEIILGYCQANSIKIYNESEVCKQSINFQFISGYKGRTLIKLQLAESIPVKQERLEKFLADIRVNRTNYDYYLIIAYTERDLERIENLLQQIEAITCKDIEFKLLIVNAILDKSIGEESVNYSSSSIYQSTIITTQSISNHMNLSGQQCKKLQEAIIDAFPALACIACLIINESRLNCFNNKAYRRL